MPAVVRELPFAEKLLLVEALWDDLARSPERIPMSDSLKAELDRRYQEYLANPAEGSTWDEVKRRVLGSK
jgi:putative addiction module component (TIGR02574 family)